MENNKEKDYQFQIKILYLLILLLFLVVLIQSFVIIYSPRNSNIRMASPDIEERYTKSEKTKGNDVNINSDIARHRLKIRDISSKTECGEKDEDAVMLNGICSIKKSELCEYCLTAEDICKRNTTETEGVQKEGKNDSEEKKKQESRHCILDNVTDYQIIPFPIFNESRRLAFAQFEEDSEGNLNIWLKEKEKPVIQKYKLHENGSYEILKEIHFPDTITDFGIVYNGSYYGRHDYEHKIVRYNFQTWESKIGDKIFHIPYVDYLFFCIDEDNIWVFNLINYRVYVIHEALQIDPENLKVLSKQEVDPGNCLIRFAFVAYGRVYCFEDLKKLRISFLSDKTEKENPYITINIDKEKSLNAVNQFYNFKEQYLYVLYESYKPMSYTLHRYKLHFNCSSEE
ncbi:uncharacterized protein LOC111631188 [Centruroides sculpturatus]|uniref:uncharacterized protein LOC111631188 n=1 Tax=Centruroides sculpturatus TaxID=218467 RepID=UPI000C6DBD8A|nr:uncharacterized protein LOC111631188 [Centruroides sculpturatus]